MRRYLGVAVALAVVAGSVPGVVGVASAQTVKIDAKTRTVALSYSETNPSATPPMFWGAFLQGKLDTRAVSDASYFVYHVGTPTVTASITGFTNKSDQVLAVRSTAGLNGHIDDLQLRTNGFDYGFGNEFTLAADGTYFLNGGVTSGGFTTYNLFANLFLNVAEQNPGATASGSASITLFGVDVVSRSGQVVGSATFDDLGNGTFDVTTTPEPASLALLGTGLLGLVPMVRRRQRR